MQDVNLDKVINHIRNRSYMSGVEREQTRVKATGEVFTPTPLVQEILDQLPQSLFKDINENFLDYCCGDGQFLGEVLIRKMENGATFEQALSTIYGVDLMIDNVDICRERLLCGREELRHIVEQNIVCADGLRYHYRFDNSPPYSKTSEEYEAIIAKLVADKHQMYKKIGGYQTEIKKLKAEITTYAEQKALHKENERLSKENERLKKQNNKVQQVQFDPEVNDLFPGLVDNP